jgi:Bacterial Ig-like domain
VFELIGTKFQSVAISSGGGLTNQTTQTITGTILPADAGLTVSIYDGSTPIGTTTPAANGTWSASVTLLAQGAQAITAQVTDAAGNVGTSSPVTYTLNTTPPAVTSVTATTDNHKSALNAGHVVTITVDTSEIVTVTGTPTLQLNDNEVATYTAGSGTSALTFTYAVQPGDSTLDLQVTGLNLPPGATIQDAALNNLSGNVKKRALLLGNLRRRSDAPL